MTFAEPLGAVHRSDDLASQANQVTMRRGNARGKGRTGSWILSHLHQAITGTSFECTVPWTQDAMTKGFGDKISCVHNA